MTVNEILHYHLQYVDEAVVKACIPSDLCDDCVLLRVDDDINDIDCPHGLDNTDPKCPRSGEYAMFIKTYAVTADLLLRETLGDVWEDEYSAR